MKIKLIITVLLVLLTGAFVFNNTVTNLNTTRAVPPPPGDNEFLIGSLQDGQNTDFKYIKDTLGFNLWHLYLRSDLIGGKYYPKGWTENDSLFSTSELYKTQVRELLQSVDNHQMKALMHRPKIEYLCYGQRSDYQCEKYNIPDNYSFYSFNEHDVTGENGTDFYDNTQYGSHQWVRYCHGLPSNPESVAGFIVRRLKANTEQCHFDTSGEAYRWDSQCDWLIKPRIRIDSNFAHNYQNTNVCRIIVLNQNRDTVKSTIIKGLHFLKEIGGQYFYNGQYLEEYFFGQNDSDLTITSSAWGDKWWFAARGTRTLAQEQDTGNYKFNRADIQVYWYGNCDMWIDYVRVDNNIADRLLKGNDIEFEGWLQLEAQDIACNVGAAPYQFYIELSEFNQIPCISYVSRKLDDIYYACSGKHINVMADALCYYQSHMNWNDRGIIDTPEKIKTVYLDSIRANQIFLGDPYPIIAKAPNGCSGSNLVNSQIPGTLNTSNDTIIANIVSSPETYDRWLQGQLDTNCSFYSGGWDDNNYLAGVFLYLMKHGDEISKISNLPFIAMLQAHQWIGGGEIDREPTNEELNLMTNLAVSYGARGIVYWGFGSFYENDCKYCKGIMNGNEPRYTNLYGEPKWEALKDMTKRLKTWGPTLMSFTNSDRHTYIYRLERTDLLEDTYFGDLFTYKIGYPSTNCTGDFPENDIPPSGTMGECKQDRYLQVAVFRKPPTMGHSELYFMIVNRRCSPFINDLNETSNGGRRFVRVRFDPDHPNMLAANNWTITDVANDDWRKDFSKTDGTVLDFGWFQPGEGRLYKMVPTAQSGGTLVADEIIPGTEEFTCEDTVWTNGYNLTIENGAKIHFSDSAKFVVEGGTFTMGNPNQSGQDITMDAAPNGSWKGFEFHGANVGIYNTAFSGLANDSISMLTFIDCPLISLKSNSFSTGNNKGCVDINYTDPWQVMSNAYIGSNTFTTGDADIPAVKVMAYSGFTTPVIIEGNNFTGNNTAIFLDNIQGGAVKSNTFTDYGRSITALSSSIDVYNNNITSSENTSYGIEALSGTELRMSYAGGLLLGGKNTITNSGTTTNNVNVDNSYFLMDEGENIFDIGSSSHHLYGWFPESYQGSYNETENCFKVNSSSVDPPNQYVTLGEQGSQISFVFTPYLTGCQQGDGGDMMAINLGNGIYDTIYIMGGGGSMKGEYIVTPKSVYDSISVSMRFRNYSNAKTLCQFFLNTFPDSSQSIGAVSKLFLAVSKTDTSTQSITNLKTLYENLILNHPNNITLVKRCNYFVQKCKVLLHQYSSALSGFQQIINQNPSNYEGLVARWDYMATSLLMQGQGGAERGSIPFWSDGDDDPTSPLTKEEKKQIKQTVSSVLEVSKTTEKKKIDILTQLSEKGDELAAVKLKVIKALEQTVKVERPKDIVEHMKIVTNDIKKVFVNPNAGKNKNNSLIPTVFNLSQNYPNPFNPKTKISYDIPKNSFVKLIVYDILGREVIRLINNEYKQPGRYVVEFNGTNLASGVYFYRIEAGDYVNSKKMVLVK